PATRRHGPLPGSRGPGRGMSGRGRPAGAAGRRRSRRGPARRSTRTRPRPTVATVPRLPLPRPRRSSSVCLLCRREQVRKPPRLLGFDQDMPAINATKVGATIHVVGANSALGDAPRFHRVALPARLEQCHLNGTHRQLSSFHSAHSITVRCVILCTGGAKESYRISPSSRSCVVETLSGNFQSIWVSSSNVAEMDLTRRTIRHTPFVQPLTVTLEIGRAHV